jgi:hypothetical protein
MAKMAAARALTAMFPVLRRIAFVAGSLSVPVDILTLGFVTVGAVFHRALLPPKRNRAAAECSLDDPTPAHTHLGYQIQYVTAAVRFPNNRRSNLNMVVPGDSLLRAFVASQGSGVP